MICNCSKFLYSIALVMAPTLAAGAAIIDFDPPMYKVGNLAGQVEWQQREGTADFITILGPEGGSISGFSSASIHGPGGSAYRKELAGFGTDGTAAHDVNIRFLYRKTQRAGFGGLSISGDGLGDSSAGVRVNETAIEALTTGGSYVNLRKYNINDVVEFSLDIDLDTSIYHLSMRNESAKETEFTRLTETPLVFQVPLAAADNMAIMISGQDGQSIYDEIRLDGANPAVPLPLPPAAFLFGIGLGFLGLVPRSLRQNE